MKTLRQSALGMFSRGITTLGEVLRVSTADH
jgi:type II secretory ATPase GspE/PulE/Tfp pilus assembly ATPase PilB-like protein